MQIDFHHATTYVVARLAGFPQPQAATVAHASQYVDDATCAGMIRFDNGAVLQIECSWASNVKTEVRFVELRGEKAGLTWRDGNFVEMHTEQDGQLVDVKPAGNLRDEGHARNLQNFVEVLLDGAEPCYKPQQGVDMIKILSAVYESAKIGKEVRL